MKKDEKIDDIKETARQLNISMQLISKGRCWINFGENSFKMGGDERGLELIGALTQDEIPDVRAVLNHFGWDYDTVEGDGLSGEGIIAYMLFNIIMGGITDNNITKNIFKNISFRLKNER